MNTPCRCKCTYYICTVKLENFNLSHVPVYIMSWDQLSFTPCIYGYSEPPDLFGGSEYIGKPLPPTMKNANTEALEDAQFAAIIREAEKYLSYPTIWGGSTPATSFDAAPALSSYVYNNCGVGWASANWARPGCWASAQVYLPPMSDRAIWCSSKAPTTAGASHVGIYIGNDMMLPAATHPVPQASIQATAIPFPCLRAAVPA